MININTQLTTNEVALTLNEKANKTLPFDYVLTATNIQTNVDVVINLVETSLDTNRLNLFEIDGALFEENEYFYKVEQVDGEVVETGKLLAYNDSNNDVYFEVE
jgi:hypothetical protein